MNEKQKFFAYSMHYSKCNEDYINLKNIALSKSYSEFIMRLGLAGIKEFKDIEILIYMVSSALKSENFDFVDTVARAIKDTDMFDSALKRGGKKFLNLCGKYISKNYHRTNKTYYVNMCRIVCAISDKFPSILGKDW